jgi:hypothetical protein
MEVEDAVSTPANELGRSLRVAAARELGVGPEQLRWIGVDPELFEVFYRGHVEEVQRFVARRVGERERAADRKQARGQRVCRRLTRRFHHRRHDG